MPAFPNTQGKQDLRRTSGLWAEADGARLSAVHAVNDKPNKPGQCLKPSKTQAVERWIMFTIVQELGNSLTLGLIITSTTKNVMC